MCVCKCLLYCHRLIDDLQTACPTVRLIASCQMNVLISFLHIIAISKDNTLSADLYTKTTDIKNLLLNAILTTAKQLVT